MRRDHKKSRSCYNSTPCMLYKIMLIKVGYAPLQQIILGHLYKKKKCIIINFDHMCITCWIIFMTMKLHIDPA